MGTALIIVDVQNDFCEGGSLPVEGGREVADRIARRLEQHGDNYNLIVATYDWHQPDGPEHFATEGTEPDYDKTWPAHCVAGTLGSVPPRELFATLMATEVTEVFKGQETAAFSGFEGKENRDGSGLQLIEILGENAIDEVHVCGLALDYCVKATALDAVKDFDTVLLRSLTAPVNPDNAEAVVKELHDAGVKIV